MFCRRASAKASLLVSSYLVCIYTEWNPVQVVGAWRGRFDSGGLLRIRAKRVLPWTMVDRDRNKANVSGSFMYRFSSHSYFVNSLEKFHSFKLSLLS